MPTLTAPEWASFVTGPADATLSSCAANVQAVASWTCNNQTVRAADNNFNGHDWLFPSGCTFRSSDVSLIADGSSVTGGSGMLFPQAGWVHYTMCAVQSDTGRMGVGVGTTQVLVWTNYTGVTGRTTCFQGVTHVNANDTVNFRGAGSNINVYNAAMSVEFQAE